MKNTDFTALARRLASNPNYIAEEEEATLRELLAIHSVGMLDPEMIKEMESVIQTSPLAASIWREFQTSEEDLKTDAGQAWLEKSREEFIAKLPFPRAANIKEFPEPFEMAAASAAPELTEFVVAGKPGIRVIVRHPTARLAVYDDAGEPSTSLNDHRIFGRTPDKTELQDFGCISGWKGSLPHGATLEHLLSPDGSHKVTLSTVPSG